MNLSGNYQERVAMSSRGAAWWTLSRCSWMSRISRNAVPMRQPRELRTEWRPVDTVVTRPEVPA